MTLPASGNPIGLGDIADEFGIAQSNVSLRDRSDAFGFSTPDAISEFLGQTHTSNAFGVSLGYATAVSACSNGIPATQTIYGSNSTYELNTRFWVDSSFSSPFDGSDLYYMDGDYALQIDSDGNVTDSDVCI